MNSRGMFAVVSILLIGLLFLQAVKPPVVMAAAQNESTRVDRFTIYVGYLGFNDTSGNLTLSVNQGDTVIITFIWNDSNLPFDNTHQIGIDGYNLKTGLLNPQTNTSMMEFTADSVGVFKVHCVVPCLGNDALQNGWLAVKSPGSGNKASTNLSILSAYTSNGSFFVSAHLTESNGAAIAGALVDFSMQTDFGVMPVGSNTSTSKGHVIIVSQMPATGSVEIFASFAGSGSLNSSSALATLNASTPCLLPGRTMSSSNLALQLMSDPPTSVTPCVGSTTSPPSSSSESPYVNGQENGMDFRLVGVPPITAEVVVDIFIFVLISVYVVIALILVKVLGIRRKIAHAK